MDGGHVSMNNEGIKDEGAYLVKALVCECQPKVLGLLAIYIAWRWFAIVDVAVHRGVITGSEPQPAHVSGSDAQPGEQSSETGHVHWGSMDGGDGVLLPTHLSVLSASDIHRGRHLALARDAQVPTCASAGEGKRDRQGELETKERKQPLAKASVLPAKLATNKATSITRTF
jgi:hypothetical protein